MTLNVESSDIKLFREQRNLSLSDLALLLSEELSKEFPTSVNPSTISRWENGNSTPRASYLRALKKIMTYHEDHGVYTDVVKKGIGINESRIIAGTWKTTWSYERNGDTFSHRDELIIEHNGDIITGKSVSNKNFNYRIIAHLLSDNTISGKWYSILDRSVHHGVFMIDLKRNGKKGFGSWLGTYDDHEEYDRESRNNNRPNYFMTGKWDWVKILS